MKESNFEKIFDILDIKKMEIAQYFYAYGMRFIQNAKQMKVQGHSGRDLVRKVDEFDVELNDKLSGLLNDTEQIILKLGRKLSSKQYDKMASTYEKTWKDIVEGFKDKVSQEFEVTESLGNMFNMMVQRYSQKIIKHFAAMKVMADTKIDKIYCWTVVSTVMAGLSLLVSMITLWTSLR